MYPPSTIIVHQFHLTHSWNKKKNNNALGLISDYNKNK